MPGQGILGALFFFERQHVIRPDLPPFSPLKEPAEEALVRTSCLDRDLAKITNKKKEFLFAAAFENVHALVRSSI